ncbi:MAG: PBSX family phage terminase large subunit [Ruminococcus sp.]|nr:PBSX family phage terminase large subunit [Ruminococcus sp.]
MRYKPFSKKQLTAMFWWAEGSGFERYDAIICDGAVRSGKTFSLSLSFVIWATFSFDKALLGFCGKTITALRRNVIMPLLPCLKELGFAVRENIAQNRLTISCLGHENTFYLFSGKDESSASLIQGVTLSGVMFDEVALMPRSFVEQALARCSIAGSRFFFNCNPEFPSHWFYKEWIQNRRMKNALYIHFTMRDNPSLSEKMLSRYESLYTGAFYRRFVLGEWVSVSGAVYPFMDDSGMFIRPPESPFDEYCVSCDYGTVNPTSIGFWARSEDTWYRLREYYYDARKEGRSKTDEEHYSSLEELCGGVVPAAVIVDPSAASFIEVIQRHGVYTVHRADNNVIDGIRKTSQALKNREIVICDTCTDAIREFSLYRWDENKPSDTVVKRDDHAMDDIRYFVSYIKAADEGFECAFIDRR